MKKVLSLFAMLLFALGCASTAKAAAPAVTVTKARLYTGAYTYTASIDHATSVTGAPRDSAYWPTATGGCVVSGHTNPRNHAKILDGIACSSPGTVTFGTKPDYSYPCGTVFTLTAADGTDVTTYTDQLTAPCAPVVPAVIVLTDGDAVGFINPAEIDQEASYGRTVPDLACTYTGDPSFVTETSTRFAGTGPNTYVYYWAFVHGTVPAGATVILTLVCP